MRWPPGEAAVRALLAGNDLLLQPPDLAAARRGLLDALDAGRLPRARLVEAVERILALKRRLPPGASGDLSTVDGPAARDAALAVAAKAVTVLKGRWQPARRLRVTASAGRDRARDWLVEALRDAGVAVERSPGAAPTSCAAVVPDRGPLVHLVGYGDTAEDLAADAAVTVAMDTPYLLAAATSPVLLATYSSSRASMVALAAVLAGHAPAPGRSPVPPRG
jgi:beta-N-acetylhexosaminidase